MAEEENLSQEDQDILRQLGENNQNKHSFLTKVIKSKSTTKTGNVSEEELGIPKLPLRTHLELGKFCRDIAGDDAFADYFEQIAEIHTSSSLSKDGFLLKLATADRKELADMTPKRKSKNRGWFKSKDANPMQE